MRRLWQLCNCYRRLSFVLTGAALPASHYSQWWRQCALALQYISTSTCANNSLPWEAPSHETLLRKIEGDMKDGNVDEAMQSFGDYKRLHGLPEPRVLNSVIVSLSYTSSRRWLLRAFDLVLSIYRVNSNLLNSGSLMRLALALARDQMPVPASTVLRIMLETKMLPDVNMLSMSFMHMVKSQVGSYLAADVLAETCECYLDHVTDRRQLKRSDLPSKVGESTDADVDNDMLRAVKIPFLSGKGGGSIKNSGPSITSFHGKLDLPSFYLEGSIPLKHMKAFSPKGPKDYFKEGNPQDSTFDGSHDGTPSFNELSIIVFSWPEVPDCQRTGSSVADDKGACRNDL
ncbi:hypothetical protein PR202_gb21267 [Eleusine coracana subsp. coracana]|uniref:At1g68980-like TPR repeats domain-containing protein n=1 Tax=Eleusine coracana subsp. coracana TaxID=191504 RepID=A0AAV5FAR8_ELECO|nr:hypothetical protein PR202_gb21267 [Eleusine coracana subsp. coracana]